MTRAYVHWGQSLPLRRRRSLPPRQPLAQAAAYACEMLERRMLLTSNLFLDFGDAFPAGGLQMTVQQLRNAFGAGTAGLQGPDLRQPDDATTAGVNEQIADGDNLLFTRASQLVTFDYNGDSATDGTDYTDLRADVMSLVQRYFAPFDVNVQLAPAVGDLGTSADYINDARATLQQGANTNGEYDGWVFISTVTHQGAVNASAGALTGNFGVSNGGDIDGQNAADNVALTYADQVFAAATNTDIDTRLAYTAAHEAGHDFGLRHTNNGNGTSGNAQTDADMALQTASNLVTGSAPGNVRTNFVFATRFPLVRGDGNSIANGGTFDITDTRIPYDRLANSNNLGLRAGSPALVTGTGAFDQITLTPGAAGFANVAVETHRDATFANQIGATYSYSVPLANGVLIEAGASADRVVFDGTIAANVTLRGMAGNDQLVVDGNNLSSGTYTPGAASQVLLDGNTSFTGQLNLTGGANIRIEEFEAAGSVTVQDVQALTFVTPNGADDVDFSTPSAGVGRLDGTSDGVGLVPLLFTDVDDLVIDTGANDGAPAGDSVLIAGSIPAGLLTLSVQTGAGSDELDVNFNFGNAIPIGGLSFDAGTGAGDLLSLRGGVFNSVTYTPSGPNSGTIDLDGSIITYANLAPIHDTVDADVLTFNGTAGSDVINVVDGPDVGGFDTTQINSGNGTFELLNFANKALVEIQGQNGADAFNVAGLQPADGLTALQLFGEDVANAGDDGAADAFNIGGAFPGIPTSAFGGGGPDTFAFVGAGAGAGSSVVLDGQGGDDTFNVTASPDAPQLVTGGPDTDVLNVDGAGASFIVTDTTFTAAGLQPITYVTLEQLELGNGTFEVSGVVTTPIDVNAAATLVGTGTASGGVTVNAGGTVAPGVGGPGILGSGNLQFTGGAYVVDINGTTPGTDHDQLNVTGAADLGAGVATLGATVGYGSIPGDEVVILRNDGADAVAGFFAGAPQGAIFDFGGGQKFTIDYAFDADGDAAFNDVALIRYGAQLAPDPCDPSEMALFVSATAAGDDVRVVPATGNARGQVLINGVDEGVFAFKGHIYIMGQNGDDTVAVTMPSRAAFLYGNTGNDTVLAGNSNSILIGGFGNDLLVSGNGKDVLIGGVGADVLRGQNGADILIAGATTYDGVSAANRVALCEVADLWKHGHNPASLGGLLNGATLINDNDVDHLFGGHGSDWLILNTTGAGAIDLSDAEKKELLTDLA